MAQDLGVLVELDHVLEEHVWVLEAALGVGRRRCAEELVEEGGHVGLVSVQEVVLPLSDLFIQRVAVHEPFIGLANRLEVVVSKFDVQIVFVQGLE